MRILDWLLSRAMTDMLLYEYSKPLNSLLKEINDDIDEYGILDDSESYGFAEIKTKNFKFYFWNLNKYYGWLTDGRIFDLKTNKTFTWSGKHPGRYEMYRFNKRLNQHLLLYPLIAYANHNPKP